MHQSNFPYTAEDRQRHPYLTSVLNPVSQKVIATAAVRVYHASFHASQNDWSPSKLKGILVFGRDRDSTGNGGNRPTDRGEHGLRVKEKYWFRLVDVKTDRVVWMFAIPEVFEYNKDKPFFHFFSGTTRRFGFCFDEDEEAALFYKTVTQRTRRHLVNKLPTSPKPKKNVKFNPKQPTPLKTSMISGPTPHSFVHVSHVGINNKGNIETSKNIGPAWAALIADLQGHGVPQNVVEDNFDFVEGFLAGAKSMRKSTPRPDATFQQLPQAKIRVHRKPVPSAN